MEEECEVFLERGSDANGFLAALFLGDLVEPGIWELGNAAFCPVGRQCDPSFSTVNSFPITLFRAESVVKAEEGQDSAKLLAPEEIQQRLSALESATIDEVHKRKATEFYPKALTALSVIEQKQNDSQRFRKPQGRATNRISK